MKKSLAKTLIIILLFWAYIFLAAVVGLIVDALPNIDLTDGSIDGAENTLGVRGFGIGFAITSGIFGLVTAFFLVKKNFIKLGVLIVSLASFAAATVLTLDAPSTPNVKSEANTSDKVVKKEDEVVEKKPTPTTTLPSAQADKWIETGESEFDQSQSVNFWENDKQMIAAVVVNNSPDPMHYRIKLAIEVQYGRSRVVPFCTTSPIEPSPNPQTANLKAFRGDTEGDIWARLINGGSGLSWTYSVESVEKSLKWCGAH